MGQEGKPHLTQSLPFQSQNIYARKALFAFQQLTLMRDENTLSMKGKWL